MQCIRGPRLSALSSPSQLCALHARPALRQAVRSRGRAPLPVPAQLPVTALQRPRDYAIPNAERDRALRAPSRAGSQVQSHQNRVLPPVGSRIVTAAHVQVAKSRLPIEGAGCLVARAHLEKDAACIGIVRDRDEMLQQIAAEAAALPCARDTEIEQV